MSILAISRQSWKITLIKKELFIRQINERPHKSHRLPERHSFFYPSMLLQVPVALLYERYIQNIKTYLQSVQ